MTSQPDLPAGLTARPYAGPADHPAMVELINSCERTDGDDDLTTLEDLETGYRHLERCDPATDMVMVEDSSKRLIGYTRCTWWDTPNEGQRRHAVFARVHPDARPRGLEEWLLSWSEARNAEIAAGHDTELERVYESWAAQRGRPDLCALLERRSYRAVTYGATMVRPHLDAVPEPPLPDGVEIRPVQPEHLRSIWEADVEAFRDHYGWSEPTEEDYRRFCEFPHRDESLWKVAWSGDRVVGQVRSFINPAENEHYRRRRGYTEFISTAREWRGRGIATALISASLTELRNRGMTEAALGVHTENPTGAFRLYQGLGFEVTEMWTTYQKPFRPPAS